jgi:hypothetical protein
MAIRIKYNQKKDRITVEGSGNVDVSEYIKQAHIVKEAMRRTGSTRYVSDTNDESVWDLRDIDGYNDREKKNFRR